MKMHLSMNCAKYTPCFHPGTVPECKNCYYRLLMQGQIYRLGAEATVRTPTNMPGTLLKDAPASTRVNSFGPPGTTDVD